MSQMEYLLECINFTLVHFSVRILQENVKALYLKTGFFLKFSKWNNWKVDCHRNYREIKVFLKHSPFLYQKKKMNGWLVKNISGNNFWFSLESVFFLNVKLLKS